MRKTNSENESDQMLTCNLEGLQKLLGCGRYTAEQIAHEAGAKIKIGRRALYNVEKVRAYIDKISE